MGSPSRVVLRVSVETASMVSTSMLTLFSPTLNSRRVATLPNAWTSAVYRRSAGTSALKLPSASGTTDVHGVRSASGSLRPPS